MIGRLLFSYPLPKDDEFSDSRWPIEPENEPWGDHKPNPWRHLTSSLPMSVMHAWSAFCQTWFGIGCFMLFGTALWEGERLSK